MDFRGTNSSGHRRSRHRNGIAPGVNGRGDSGDRVIFDPDRNLYAVVDRYPIYYYDPHASAPDVDFPGWPEEPERLAQVADGGADSSPATDTDEATDDAFAQDRWDQLLNSPK